MLVLLPVLLQLVTSLAPMCVDAARLVGWRRALHRRPELAFAEHRSTALVRSAVAGLAVEPVALPTPTGAAFLLDGGPGPTVLVRADLDALPIRERTGLPFASREPGVMHACGHDAHTAIALGLAHTLAARSCLPGRVLLLFQPAEELLSGARAVLADGLLDRFDVAAVLAAHVTPALPVGTVGLRAGMLLAGAIGYRALVRGRPGHGALVRDGDALAAAADLALRLRGAVTPVTGGWAPLPVVTVCTLNAGTAPNVTAEHAECEGTLRYTEHPQRHWRAMRRVAADVADEHGVQVDLQRAFGAPPVHNAPDATAAVAARLAARLSFSALRWLPGVLPTSDDAAELLAARPGCYLMLGAAGPDPASRVAHSPRFDVDEAVLPFGVDVLAHAVDALLAENSG